MSERLLSMPNAMNEAMHFRMADSEEGSIAFRDISRQRNAVRRENAQPGGVFLCVIRRMI